MAAVHAREPAPMRWLTIPNLVSVLRLIVFVPLTIWLAFQPGQEVAATISLVAFGATDWIDGFLARGLGQVSRVGEILDPVADRFGIILIGLALALAGRLPWWVIITVAVTDLILGVIALFRMRRVREGRVTWIGKIRTAILMAAMPASLLSFAPEFAGGPLHGIAEALLVVGTALHVVAAAGYARRYLSPTPAQPTRTDGHVVTPRPRP